MNSKIYGLLYEDFVSVNDGYKDLDNYAIDKIGYIAQANLLLRLPRDLLEIHEIVKALYLYGYYSGIREGIDVSKRKAATISHIAAAAQQNAPE